MQDYQHNFAAGKLESIIAISSMFVPLVIAQVVVAPAEPDSTWDNLLNAAIPAIAALIGALIPTVFTYFNNRSQREFDSKKADGERQRKAYDDLIVSLQRTINSPEDKQLFLEYQQCVVRVSICGDLQTVSCVNNYWSEVVGSNKPDATPLTASQHQAHQQKMLNAIRENMGLNPLSSFELIAVRAQ